MFGRRSPLGRRLGLVAAVFLLLGTGLGVAYWQFGGGPSPNDPGFERPPEAGIPPPGPDPAAKAVKSEEIRIESNTMLVFERRWERCSEVHTQSTPAGEHLEGMTRERFSTEFPEWEIASFDAATVRLVQSLPGSCPEPQAPFTIAIHDGRVVVLRGEGLAGPVYFETSVRAQDLLPGDLALLERGVTVVGEGRVWQYLEGIRDHSRP